MGPAKKHVDELLKLSADERSEAAETLLRSLEADPDDPGVEQAWADELQQRIADNAPGIPAATVFADGRRMLDELRRLWAESGGRSNGDAFDRESAFDRSVYTRRAT